MENYATPNQDEQGASSVSDQVLSNTPEPLAPFVPSGVGGQASSDGYKDEGWSWGGFALNWIFVVAVRKYVFLFLLPLIIVPFLNAVVFLGMMFYLGIEGRKLARESRTFANHEQYLGFMKAVDHAGKYIMVFYLVAIVIGIVGGITLASLGNARDRAYEASLKQQQATEQYQIEMDDNWKEMN